MERVRTMVLVPHLLFSLFLTSCANEGPIVKIDCGGTYTRDCGTVVIESAPTGGQTVTPNTQLTPPSGLGALPLATPQANSARPLLSAPIPPSPPSVIVNHK